METIRESLLRDGFAIVPDVLDETGLAVIREAAARMVEAAPQDHLAANRTTGSMLDVTKDPIFAALIAWPRTLATLRGLGFGRVAFSAGYVISKPGGGPRLFWHQDWLWWTHPVSAEPVPHQIFAMYYLVDTTRDNGCLRVVPGSHRKRLPAHDALGRAHSPEALAGADEHHAMFGDLEGEIDVPVRAGDLLIGDARLLHAAHRNASNDRRTLVTLWYHPAWDDMPAPLRAYLAERDGGALDAWPTSERNRIDCLLPFAGEPVDAWPLCREPHVGIAAA